MTKIIIGSDHGGFNLKQEVIKRLNTLNYEVLDLGCYTQESCDYPFKSICSNGNPNTCTAY